VKTHVKDTENMRVHGLSLEAPLEKQNGYLTPIEQFFVCNSGSTPLINAQDFSLRIWGDGVAHELVLSYSDLLKMAQHDVPALLECAGNHRSFFRDIDGIAPQTPPGTEELIWSTGAVGMAEWSGVPLRSLLAMAGVKDNALLVCPRGSETDSCEGEVRMPMPLHKAMDRDTLLAITMNGSPLPADHGYPVRVLVPGWIGAYSVKWVKDIEVTTEQLWVQRNTKSYVLQGDHWPAMRYAPAKGELITWQNIKSSLALPWPASLPSGRHTLHGYARSPGSPIASVMWSDDKGLRWRAATLGKNNERYGWVRFEFDWQAIQGQQMLMTKALDQLGQSQPTSIPFNTGGYLYNAIHPHPVCVYPAQPPSIP